MLHSFRLSLGLLVGIGLLAPACGSSESSPAGNPASDHVTTVKSSLARELAPPVPDSDANALAEGNAAFAADLYGRLRANPGNFVFSPFSSSIALAMTYAGARAATAQEMATALHFTLAQDKLHPAFDALDLALASRNQLADPATGKGFRLTVANSLWAQSGLTFEQPFLDTLAVSYGAGLETVDIENDPETARSAINDWVSQATSGKIVDLLKSLSPKARLVLTNAIYFNASWWRPFDAADTHDAAFHTLASGDVTAKLMSADWPMRYAEGPGFQLVEVQYEGGKAGMTIVVPDSGHFDGIESALTGEWLATATGAEAPAEVVFSMPKFSFATSAPLGDSLKALGMPSAFGPTADFSGITDPSWLYIFDVVHQAFVGVDERGTEAAAATAVVMGKDASVGPPPKQVVLDRPFLFFVRDYPTGAILFAGRVVDPTAS